MRSFSIPQPVLIHAYLHGTLAIDGDGASTNGGGIVGTVARGEIALTAQAATLVKRKAAVGSAGGYGVPLAGYTSQTQFFPDALAAGDAVYLGAAKPFAEVSVECGVLATYDDAAVIEWLYSTAAGWDALAIVNDGTDAADASGGRPFQQDGAIHFLPPPGWAAAALAGQTAYWIAARIAAGKAANMTQTPQGNVQPHALVAPAHGLRAPASGYVDRVRAWTEAATLHSAADVKFFIMNFTTGARSAELTWPMGAAVAAWADVAGTGAGSRLAVAAGDELGLVVTQEDGTNELANVHLDLTIAPRI